MNINLFDKDITLRDKYCMFFGNEGSDITEPYINLYVRFKGCNADCLFCEFKEIANHFNFKKYEEILAEIKRNSVELRKIQFTGGEPTLNYSRFKDVLKFTKEEYPNTYIGLNTNGLKLVQMFADSTVDYIDNIGLSKHHYNNKINDRILGFKSISNEEIGEVQSNHTRDGLLHFGCTLVKGGVDTNRKVINFLENANELNVFSAGFVSLLQVNEYCTDNFIDINILKLKKGFFNSKQFEYPEHCTCRNYLYTPKNFKGEHIKLYLKNTYKNQDTTNSLIFDGEYLRYGFGENNIIY